LLILIDCGCAASRGLLLAIACGFLDIFNSNYYDDAAAVAAADRN